MTLDQEYTRLEYEKIKDELEVRQNNIVQQRLEYDKDLQDIDYRAQIKSLEVEQLKAELKDQKRLKEVGGSTAEEVESVELRLKVAEIEEKILFNELEFNTASSKTTKEPRPRSFQE